MPVNQPQGRLQGAKPVQSLQCLRLCDRLAQLTKDSWTGSVHSIFTSALNLQVGGRLITLLPEGRSLYPLCGILAEKLDFTSLGLTQGGRVVVKNQKINIEERLWVSLAQGAPVDLSVEGLSGLCPPQELAVPLNSLARVIERQPEAAHGLAPVLASLVPGGRAPKGLPLNTWCVFLLPRLRQLPQLVGRAAPEAAGEAAKTMAGCGPGLTPSSDDFISGLLAALWAGQRAGLWQREDAAQWCRVFAAGAAKATGDISANYLVSGGEGYFSEEMLALLASCFSQTNGDELPSRAEKVAGFGSSSGVDSLAGLWYGLYLLSARGG